MKSFTYALHKNYPHLLEAVLDLNYNAFGFAIDLSKESMTIFGGIKK